MGFAVRLVSVSTPSISTRRSEGKMSTRVFTAVTFGWGKPPNRAL